MPEDSSGTQIELKKLLAASLSQETKRIIEGLTDGSIVLTVPTALEIIRNHVYTPPVKEYLTRLVLMFGNEDVNKTYVVLDGKRVEVPIDISKSKFFKSELVKYLTMESTAVWTEIFRDSVAFSASASINKQPTTRSRHRTRMEDLLW